MKWYTYMVECSDQTIYTGVTINLAKRIEAHNQGKGARYTAQRAPVKLVWHEQCRTQSLALIREIEIKKWTRKKKLGHIKAFTKTN